MRGPAAQHRTGTPEKLAATVAEVVTHLEQEVAGLRVLIADLRPAALDELGLGAAVRDLAARARSQGLQVTVDVELGFERGRPDERLTGELELALYRIAQEALTNARKHGNAA